MNFELPQVIFFDAVGTLFEVKGSVGQVYSFAAERFGVQVSAVDLDRAFRQSFAAAAPPAFAQQSSRDISKAEFDWWEKIVRDTFAALGVLEQFSRFDQFYFELYSSFATAQPWIVYDDVIPALEYWQSQGVELGIISNFDTRLYKVLQQLQLKQFFTSITISSRVGAAKPDSKIFLEALGRHQCLPEAAWHIGDSLEEDYYGARSVGIKAFLIKRPPGLTTPNQKSTVG